MTRMNKYLLRALAAALVLALCLTGGFVAPDMVRMTAAEAEEIVSRERKSACWPNTAAGCR